MATDTLTGGGQGRELTGRTVLMWLVGFFAVVGAVNAIMIGAAISTFAGLEHDSPYQAGLAFDPGATRVARLAEAVAIVTRLLEGEPVTFAGRHYRVTNHTIHPRPVQRPRPPVFIGGSAPRLLRVAAQHADIVGFTGIAFRAGGTAPEVADFRAAIVDTGVRLVREAAAARFEQLELNALVQRVIVTDDRRKAADELTTRSLDG